MPKIRRATLLERFYLLKDSQGNGLAHLAMQELITWISINTRCDTIHLTVFVENHRAQKFYQKYGFTYAGDTIYHGRVAELQFLRFRRPHDPHVPTVHCGHSSSSVLNLFVRLHAHHVGNTKDHELIYLKDLAINLVG